MTSRLVQDSVATLLFLTVAACSSKSTTTVKDAGNRDAGASDAGDASSETGSIDAAANGADADELDTGAPPTRDTGTSPTCTERSDCAQGQRCCGAIGGLSGAPKCTPGEACPSGELEFCGKKGTGQCNNDSCAEYECTLTLPRGTTTFYACSAPTAGSGTCARVPEGGLIGTGNDAGDAGEAGL